MIFFRILQLALVFDLHVVIWEVVFENDIFTVINHSESVVDNFHEVSGVLAQVKALDGVLAQVTRDFTIVDDRDLFLVFVPLNDTVREVEQQPDLVLVTSVLVGAQWHYLEVIQLEFEWSVK